MGGGEPPESSEIIKSLVEHSMDSCIFWKFSWVLREFCIYKANFNNN